MDRDPLRIWVDDEIDGESVSLDRVPLSLLRDFSSEVAQFLRGDDNPPDETLIVKVENGSFAVVTVAEQTLGVYRDIALLNSSQDVSSIDPKRAKIVLKWQQQATAHKARRYCISDGTRTVFVNHNSQFFTSEQSLWVKVRRKIVGEVQDIGGAKKPNVHLLTQNGVVYIDSDHQTLAEEKTNRLYKRVLVSVVAEENVATGEMRNPTLLKFEDYSPDVDAAGLREMQVEGGKAWAGVDSVAWVRRLREG
ncbi:hypothetical protein DXT57_07835 [Stenotrophomonas maltophilia]|uniref:hypothetical protein n=1 Tax=Stenotrophomonas maltophilia TaxID=40324 RepID=UPI000E27BF98|nr:hypothetical protein [Stenotrophomonas maltophilia]REC87103.1 hypothetical protein DXT57_07835 [Stenotrophomonas maltophilia]